MTGVLDRRKYANDKERHIIGVGNKLSAFCTPIYPLHMHHTRAPYIFGHQDICTFIYQTPVKPIFVPRYWCACVCVSARTYSQPLQASASKICFVYILTVINIDIDADSMHSHTHVTLFFLSSIHLHESVRIPCAILQSNASNNNLHKFHTYNAICAWREFQRSQL